MLKQVGACDANKSKIIVDLSLNGKYLL